MLAAIVDCYYNLLLPTWDEIKRRRSIELHGLDFEGADAIWDNFTVTREDIRAEYGEKRLVTLGILNGEVVVLVHTERDDMHIISSRKAENYEARYYFEVAKDHFRKGRWPRQPFLVRGDAGSADGASRPRAAEGADEGLDHYSS